MTIPLQAAEHYYLITERDRGARPDLAGDRGPRATYGYYREEVGGLMIGLFEPVCAPWKVDGIPRRLLVRQLQPDWDRMAPVRRAAMSRVPISLDTGIRTFFCGPESFTPDLRPIVGPAPEVRNYFVAAGLNSIGILTGGGMGRLVAHWIVDGDPGADVTGMHLGRLHALPGQPRVPPHAHRRVARHGVPVPLPEPRRCRPLAARSARRCTTGSPRHGAYFRDVSGWEGADWYAGRGSRRPTPGRSRGAGPRWWSHWEAEHRACREGVIVMDMTFMSKFRVQGRDAGRLLDHVSANAVDGEAGAITYTQWLNERGTLEADLTVTKLDDDAVPGGRHRHRPPPRRDAACAATFGDAHAFVTDVTSGYAQLNVQGPRRATLLQSLTTRRPVERGVPVPRRARDRPRVRPRAVRAHHLPRRARLRALRPGRAGGARVRPARRRRRGRSGCGTPG